MDRRSFIWILFATLCVINLSKNASARRLTLCIAESIHTTKMIRRICPKHTPGSMIDCIVGNDRFDCLRRLTTDEADMTMLEPEDLVAVSAYSEYNILVTNELRLFPDEKQRFEMVALVQKDVEGISDVRGKRLCHPGIEATDEWTKAFSMYFEDWIIPKECDYEKTLLENRVTGISNYFEAACIAGPWSPDVVFDAKLKSKYKNLCALCESPVGCYTGDKYYGREGALLCLTDNVGDIAWVRLDDTLQYFKAENIDKSNYKYLCPDGMTRSMETGDPCVWIKKPWSAIVARRDVAEQVQKTISTLEAKFDWAIDVIELTEGVHSVPVSTDTLETPEDYLRRFPGFMSAYKRSSCRPSRRIQWCVSSNLEERKCRWLRDASFVYGVEPGIACIQEENRTACMDAVKNRRADIFVAKPDELLDAGKKGLKPIAQATLKKKEELDRIAVLVEKDSKFKSFKDLKGAKACFTGFRNVAWNAFDFTMRNLSQNWECSDSRAISEFFSDSCVLGLPGKHEDVPRNLYSLCKQGGNPGDDVSTFDCLSSGLADVAVVNLKIIEKKIGALDRYGTSKQQNTENKNSQQKEYRILCSNDGNAEDEEDICVLTSTTLASIMAHENITDMRREEIYSMLLEIDQLFGKNFPGETPSFTLYGEYDSNRSVIFPEETQHLLLAANPIKGVRNYDEIVEDIVKRGSCSSGIRWRSYFTVIALCFIFLRQF